MTVRILRGHVLDRLRELPDESVHCVVTSPPYWGLRDYGVEGQLGLEATPGEFIANMVEVFREVRRVLRSDGTAWVNMGDSYVGSRRGPDTGSTTLQGGRDTQAELRKAARSMCDSRRRDNEPIPRSDIPVEGLKPKDMVGMPWMLAFALRADGWWLRQDIIWHKKNPMPESVRDRCTKAHEYIFLLSKSERYYYDFEAIKEPASDNTHARRKIVPAGWATGDAPHTAVAHQTAKTHRKLAAPGSGIKSNASFVDAVSPDVLADRNKRSVWTVATEPFPEAHFATFPTALIEPCIRAGCPPGGVVLDIFGGAGTTAVVAERNHCNSILIELKPAYADMAERRIRADAPLFAEVSA